MTGLGLRALGSKLKFITEAGEHTTKNRDYQHIGHYP